MTPFLLLPEHSLKVISSLKCYLAKTKNFEVTNIFTFTKRLHGSWEVIEKKRSLWIIKSSCKCQSYAYSLWTSRVPCVGRRYVYVSFSFLQMWLNSSSESLLFVSRWTIKVLCVEKWCTFITCNCNSSSESVFLFALWVNTGGFIQWM